MRLRSRADSFFGEWGQCMRSFQISLIGLFCFALPGCVTQPVPPNGEPRETSPHLRKLNGDEIRRMLVDRTLSFINEPGTLMVSPAHRERYSSDGSLSVAVHRGAGRGRYRILEDRICVTVESNPERCRYLFVSEDGDQYLMPLGDDYVSGITRIRIEN